MAESVSAAPALPTHAPLSATRVAQYVGRAILAFVIVFGAIWVLFLADNAAVHKPNLFVQIFLNALTLSGLYFVVASGFTLIFGLMRVVNMAHGSFYLLGGYIAVEVQQQSWGSWGLGIVIACTFVAALGIAMQQGLLRWNQGQDLRQALITIAVSLILADQMLSRYGGIAKDLHWPDLFDRAFRLHIVTGKYPLTRMVILGIAVLVGVGLWIWLRKTRTGMVIRAGVDDRNMVSALGINIQRIFMVAFGVGSALAALGGVLGGSFAGLGPGTDSAFLLNSLIVVIIGGMGSLGGAAIGALLYGFVDSFSDIYLPHEYTNYSVILTFALLVAVLAIRPLGLFGRPA